MRFSKEKTHELKEKVRFEMVKNPHVSIVDLQQILSDYYGHRFDKNYVNKLKNKVHRERVLRLDFASLNEDLAKLEDLCNFARYELVGIVFNEEKKYKPSEIIAAFRTIFWAEVTLFEAKLNAGIFQKAKQNQTKEKPLTKEETELMNKALNYMQIDFVDFSAENKNEQ
ncbi:MAG: hypothetical protein A2655_00410 [Candidatus Yanofskybacteria bacterium RIFCSPHIGHO2_01_FULL_43_42]|uniref:Uncharacterized protein n=1 Tax=Candidatus Yanofskybacteria bacterium RIFCSPLOWO2_01_FULL_43_22 TaxID=1802695 RepID=A0A1F8GFS5_9BACT|nr:MAG: hypothetical protein A2655_00410 [Candidatus Yanofskybacteria bacterium RIFCSPHIGHO2_01_FULL_43_42]OGN13720.1 MAG: hypothetical protein A3D48_00165 [Candidatus Yanofskybacteria bacterium RIFCSPHIGHO2_02_FULL_43_17]OGN24237.1 MAG: hypothetical protein A3A13_03605 [Candidatus Yanofskybacteria bacterium RIFCSPLOWO2_01_FULL_43_22]